MDKIKISLEFCIRRSFFEKLFSLNTSHNWQTRARNRFGLSTYDVCLKCGKARERNGMGKKPIFLECKRILEFDNQFNEKGIYKI